MKINAREAKLISYTNILGGDILTDVFYQIRQDASNGRFHTKYSLVDLTTRQEQAIRAILTLNGYAVSVKVNENNQLLIFWD